MYKLYYMPLDTFCRAARVILHEKEIKFESINEPVWKRRLDFLKINPEGELPVVIDDSGNTIIGVESLAEFLDETNVGVNLVGITSLERLEVRRLNRWINRKLFKEVIEYIVDERVFKHIKNKGNPSSDAIKAGRINLKNHLNYFEWILKKKSFLAGEKFSLADISYSCALSCLDYLGEIEWKNYDFTKKWYALIKSRPSFRDILLEKIYNISPSKNYKNLDF